jgi:ABC-type nitrate/sulfonate/bicarbonate transport system substrate-binding protein
MIRSERLPRWSAGPRRRSMGVVVALAVSLAVSACGGGAAPAAQGAAASKPAQPPQASASQPGAPAPASIPAIPANHPLQITVGYAAPAADFAPLWIAADKGYFKRFGLDVKVEKVEGVVQMAGLVSGSIPIGIVGGSEILAARSKGSDVIGFLEASHYAVYELHAAKQYKSVADLKGKTIAVTRLGSSAAIATSALLAKYGLSDKEVHLLAAGSMGGILAAVQKGVAQAGLLSPPTTLKADQSGFPMVASTVQAKIPIESPIATTESFAKAHPAAVYAFIKGYLQGMADYFNKPNEAISEIEKWTHTSPALAKVAYQAEIPALEKVPYITNDGLLLEQKYNTNPTVRKLNVKHAYDNSYLTAVVNSGYLKQIGLQ